MLAAQGAQDDADLHRRLDEVGFKHDLGEDATGFHMKYIRTAGHYYINVGCSDLIADRKIALIQNDDIAEWVADGLKMKDGSHIPADAVVFATGYSNMQETVRRHFGDDVADRVGLIWGLDADHEMRNMWKKTGQERFWIMGGAFSEARMHSRWLALQIAADIDGTAPTPSAR
jgi:hypothetical protein